MKNILFKIILSVFILPVFAQDKIETNKDTKNLPDIYFSETIHDYGVMEYGGDGVIEFEFKNVGKQPLILTNVRASCGCTTPIWPKEPVKKGKKGSITVKYNTKIAGKFTKTIKVYSNAKSSMVTLTIKGEVKKPS